MFDRIIGLTTLALILYYFVLKSKESSQFINAASQGYISSLKALQGRD